MNILFTTPTFHPHKGGAESVLADLASVYAERGHNVTVVTSRSNDSPARRETRDGVEIHRLKYPPTSISNLRDAWIVGTRACVAFVQLFQLIRNKKIETVCVGLVGIDSFLVLMLHLLLRFKLIVYIHGGEIRSYIKISTLMRWTLKRCLENSYAVIAVSEELKRETIAFAPKAEPKIVVIPNGVPLADIATTQPYVHHRKYILFVGRLHPVKGIDTLVLAFQQASEQLQDLDLIIVGTGPLQSSLETLAGGHKSGENIIFLGDQERSSVFSLIRSCEFLVLPSLAEGCPITLLEALAAGKLAVARKVKGITSIIQHGVNGILFEAGNADELSELLTRFADSSPERRALEATVRDADLQPYDLQEVASHHLQVYSGVREKLRVCLISAFYYHDENCAGLSSYYFNLAESLVDQGLDVSLITPETSNALAHQSRVRVLLTTASKKTIPTGGRHSLNGLRRVGSRLRFSLDVYRKVKELDRTSGFDVAIAPELFAPALIVGLFNRDRLFTRIHTPTYVGDEYNKRSRLIGRTLSLIEKAQARRSRALSVASDHLATVITRDWKIPRHKIEVIPNSVQVDWVRSLAVDQPREVDGDYLLYFGRLEKRKGVHTIAEALPKVLSADPHIKMVFVGRDAGLKGHILDVNARNRERIIFFDTLDKRRLFGIVRHAKLVVLPSLFENMSNAGLEAMVLAKPIVGTFQTSFSEIIENEVDGFLVEPGNAEELSATILSCLARHDLEEIGQNAYRKVLGFDSNKVVKQNIAFYRRSLTNHCE